ncbi:MAG: hypothetical protein V4593_08140 [Pseudomonadota bacterium]
MTRTQSSSRHKAVNTTQQRSKSEPAPAPRRAPVSVRGVPEIDATGVDAEIAAAVEAQLATQRAELTAKMVAEKAEQKRRAAAAAAAEEVRKATEARRAQVVVTPAADVDPTELAKFQRMLAAAGVKVLPARTSAAIDDDESTVPDDDYSDTERVQVELNALLDLLGVVRARDVIEHVLRDDGSRMSPSNVRYHMNKLANRGAVKKVQERYKLPGLGWRTRDVWSKDIQKLLEILEGKKTVRS